MSPWRNAFSQSPLSRTSRRFIGPGLEGQLRVDSFRSPLVTIELAIKAAPKRRRADLRLRFMTTNRRAQVCSTSRLATISAVISSG
jgi:hypothetical protein